MGRSKETPLDKVVRYVKKEYGTVPDRPWMKYPENQVLRHKDTRKWYGLIMPVERGKLGLDGDGAVDVLNVKCDPLLADHLKEQAGILPAYHMNHAEWITILLDGSVEMDIILDQIDMSFRLTASRKKREEIRGPVEWLIPANPKYYDVVHAFDEREIIEWKQGCTAKVGDTVFLYVAAPVSAILYKCRVTEVDIPYENRELNISKVMKIQLLYRYEEDRFTFAVLNDFGVRAVRGPRKVPEQLSLELNMIQILKN